MEREANYAAVGAFVLLVIAMAVAFVYWYSDGREARDYQRYEIYFDGSVSGLTRGGTVRYLGVDVGRVVDLRVDRRDATRVQVIADIDASAPVSGNTVAELSLQGVTGLLYIDLLGSARGKTLIPAVPSDRYPVIRSVRSNFDVFVSSLPDVVAKAGEVAQRLTLILSDENIAALSRTIENVERAGASLPGTMGQVEALVRELRATTGELQQLAANVRGIAERSGPDVEVSLARLRETTERMASASGRFDALMAGSAGDIEAFSRDTLPAMQDLVREGRAAASEIEALARDLRENPSQLIYQPAPQGVVIPK